MENLNSKSKDIQITTPKKGIRNGILKRSVAVCNQTRFQTVPTLKTVSRQIKGPVLIKLVLLPPFAKTRFVPHLVFPHSSIWFAPISSFPQKSFPLFFSEIHISLSQKSFLLSLFLKILGFNKIGCRRQKIEMLGFS